ncbi:putative Glucoside xylosyltransferase 1 [Hypsibius exemplaris]|uniref:UDP-D-xylose:beta-D-glucoside alpha-1,3-D-xylosyltransferase n=1 Tax=Hypsibius exemplaris TaxID=2072580 RepID=A0A9X6NGB2_HYPEX|nr:putative Glucoside xylosyltransferase 1 [Hypsibius exemplaris]
MGSGKCRGSKEDKPNQLCDPRMTIVTVACAERVEEAFNLLKSILLFTRCNVSVVVLVDSSNVNAVARRFNGLIKAPLIRNLAVNLTVMEAKYPTRLSNADTWRSLYAACATLRLFLPEMLQELDAVIYLDADTLVVSSIEDFWAEFKSMNDSQIAALVPEHEAAELAHYGKKSRVPYVGKLVLSTYEEYQSALGLPDQDILNIIFHYNSSALRILDCKWNFRVPNQHCNPVVGFCRSAFTDVVKVVHANSGAFHGPSEKYPSTVAFFEAFQRFDPVLHENDTSALINSLRTSLAAITDLTLKCVPLEFKLLDVLQGILRSNSRFNDSNWSASSTTFAPTVLGLSKGKLVVISNLGSLGWKAGDFPSSVIRHPSSVIRHPSPSSVSHHPSTVFRHPSPSSVIRQPSSVIRLRLPSSVTRLRLPSSVIRLPSSVIRHPSSVSHHPSSVIRLPSSVIRLPSSVIRHPSSVIRLPSSVQRCFVTLVDRPSSYSISRTSVAQLLHRLHITLTSFLFDASPSYYGPFVKDFRLLHLFSTSLFHASDRKNEFRRVEHTAKHPAAVWKGCL